MQCIIGLDFGHPLAHLCNQDSLPSEKTVADSPLTARPEDRPAVAPLPLARERRALMISLALAFSLHVGVMAAFLVRLPAQSLPQEPEAIPIELVQLPRPEPPMVESDEVAAEDEAVAPPEEVQDESPELQSGNLTSGPTDDPTLEPGEAAEAEEEGETEAVEAQPEETEETELEIAEMPEPEDPTGMNYSALDNMPPAVDIARMALPQRTGTAQSGAGGGGGDPYLNAMRDRIIGNIVYPSHVTGRRAGIAEYEALVARSGTLLRIRLVNSTGSPELDSAGLDAIEKSVPFEPIPARIPGDNVIINIRLNISPP